MFIQKVKIQISSREVEVEQLNFNSAFRNTRHGLFYAISYIDVNVEKQENK